MLTYVDLILATIIFLAVYHGFRRGFILGALELLALVCSILTAFLSYLYIATFLDDHYQIEERWLFPLSFFIAILIARLIIGAIIYKLIKNISKKTHQSSLNKTLGIIPGLIRGLFYAALLALIFLFLPLWPNLISNTRNSFLANFLSQELENIDNHISPDISDRVKKSISKLTIEPESDKTVFLHFTVENAKVNENYENHLFVLVNQERKKAGIPLLERDTALRAVARAHSADMFKKGYFSHINLENKSPFDRISAHHIPYLTAGENLALAQTVEIAHTGLMNSPGHRANILNPKFRKIGIGILDGGINGLMITQNFTN
ncbi:CvpA family protein [Pedobacter sp. SD-b]|uniref:CvpA family protein n=1 Tax=Pedobacter segetis TaxID=2793069 RepID=A0ABS1BFM0_9SPHI|nr:CvpA family protein [Pedobacter segetis]MBK0381642.1 CvpA family protein [Pedobacter segetis]